MKGDVHSGEGYRFDVVLACRRKDLGVLRLALPRLRKYIPYHQCIIFTSHLNIRIFRKTLGSEVVLVDEDKVIPGMTLQDLRQQVKLPGFPQGAGWYFQQFLKLSYPRLFPDAQRYLIWDADTIPLRPIQVFGPQGQSFLTVATMNAAQPPKGVALDPQTLQVLQKATQPHAEYFYNFENLLGEKANATISFISQHLAVQTATLQAMIRKIEDRFPGSEDWCWRVIRNLRGSGGNLFSEYEFYAHFALIHAPDLHRVRSLAWSRGGRLQGFGFQKERQLMEWSKTLDFVALEAWVSPLRRKMLDLFHRLPTDLRNRIRLRA